MSGVEWMVRKVRLEGRHIIGQYTILAHGNTPDHYDVWLNNYLVFSGNASDVYWYCIR